MKDEQIILDDDNNTLKKTGKKKIGFIIFDKVQQDFSLPGQYYNNHR
jgi:hypothetical protein